MKSAKEIFDLRFFVRLACIVVIIALAIFLYNFGKQRTLYVDNWTTEINGTSYKAEDWAMVEVDDLGAQEYGQRVRRGIPLRGKTHTISITYDDRSFNEIELPVVEFSLPYDATLISIPGLVAGLPVEECLSELVVQAPPAEEAPAAADDGMSSDAGFGDMSMGF